MRASLHIKLPNLCSDGTDTKAKVICQPLGLSVRGLGGEHTPIGADGTVDISPSARFCITEAEIITALYQGIEQLKAAEDAAPPDEEGVPPQVKGACMCGAVQFHVAKVATTLLCQCERCRKFTGAEGGHLAVCGKADLVFTKGSIEESCSTYQVWRQRTLRLSASASLLLPLCLRLCVCVCVCVCVCM
jgi:hypothetical protein